MADIMSVEEVLDKNGLDKTFWLEQFKKVGIENGKQLQHADKEIFNKLRQHKRHTWEENALKACFPLIKETSSEERKEKQEYIEKMDKSLKEILQNLDKITGEEERMSRMKINVQIPSGQKILHKELAKMELLTTELAAREKLTSSKVVSTISSGRVLRGYYIHKDAWQRVVPRKQLINIPEDVEILGPRMEETFTSREFFSEEKAGLYDHVVQHWGLNATASVGVIGVFTADIGVSVKSTDDGFRSGTSQEGYTEIKETVFVPTASFTLENVSYFINKEALDELIKLESRSTEENSNIIELCVQFFKTFGSHYFAGTYHFGGRYTRSVICRTETQMTKSDTIKLSKWALQVGGVGMAEWCSVGGRAQYESSNDESRSKFKEDVDYKVEKKIIKCGGPAEADSIPQWKLGLVKYPATWNIIDQDVHKEEWRGVWELLRDDLSPKFKDIENLRATLRKVWEDEFKEKLQTIKTQKRVFLHVP